MKQTEIKSMHHLFTCVNQKELEGTDRLYSIFLSSRRSEEVVQVPDRYVVNDQTFLCGFETHWDSLSDLSSGLSYYGTTVIPSSSLLVFRQRLKEDPNASCLKELIQLCSVAMEKGLDLLHWGI